MMKRFLAIAFPLLLILILLITAIVYFAPQSSDLRFGETISQAQCLKSLDDTCLTMPSISGVNMDNAPILLPDDFTGDYHLVVMPFDREQQVLAVTWLPLFQELAAERENSQFWSIAALPNLNAGIRLLVLGGMSGAVREPELRSQISVFFLEEQAAFLDSLAIEDIAAIQVFIMDRQGTLYYRDSGEFDEEKGVRLREIWQDLP